MIYSDSKKARMVPFWEVVWGRSLVAGLPATASQVSWTPDRTLTTRPVSDQRAPPRPRMLGVGSKKRDGVALGEREGNIGTGEVCRHRCVRGHN